MPDKLIIEAAWVGLPETATSEEVAKAVRAQNDKIVTLEAEVSRWQDRAEEGQRALMEARKDQEAKKDLEGKLLIAEARTAKKIFKADEDFYLKLFKTNPELCRERIAQLREMRWMENQDSLKGPIGDPPADALGEFNALVAQELANDKALKQGEAVIRVQRANPELSERVWQAQLVASKKEGKGERD